MAFVDENDVTLGLRGRFGRQFVFRKFGPRTIAARRGTPSETQTEGQLAHRARFLQATQYARVKMLDPQAKAEYLNMARANDHGNAFAAAVGDFLKAINIGTIETTGYTGAAGYPIVISVNDVQKVKEMTVTLRDTNGTVLESGLATLATSTAGWTYITTVAIPDITGVEISVEVTDRPGNQAQKAVVL